VTDQGSRKKGQPSSLQYENLMLQQLLKQQQHKDPAAFKKNLSLMQIEQPSSAPSGAQAQP